MNRSRIASLALGLVLAASCYGATFPYFIPASGVLKGDANSPTTTAAAYTDIVAMWTSCASPSTKVLKADGTCSTFSTVTPAALTKADDTNVTLTLGGTPATSLLQATSITAGWTGQLAASRGGTGVSSLGTLSKVDDTNVTLTLGGTPTGALVTSTSITAGWTGTLAASRGGLGMSTVTDDTVAVANGSAWQSKALTDCDAATSAVTYDTTTNAWGCNTINGATGANPSGTIGLSAVNGVATTFTRSDGAPALSQAIAPTWTGAHTFTQAQGSSRLSISGPNTGQGWNVIWRDTTNAANRAFLGLGTDTVTGAAVTDFAISPGTSGSIVIGTANGGAIATRFGPTGAITTSGSITTTAASPGITLNDPTAGKSTIRFQSNGSTAGYVNLSGAWEGDSTTDMALVGETGNGLRFYTGGSATERLTIDAGGASTFSGSIAGTSGTWSGTHTYTSAGTTNVAQAVAAADANITWRDTSSTANSREFRWRVASQRLLGYTSNDNFSTGRTWVDVTNSAGGVGPIVFGNSTDNPTYTFSGTGAATFGGPINVTGATSRPLVLNSTNGSGPYEEWQRSGTAFANLGNGAECGGGFTLDAFCISALTGNSIQLGAGGRTTPDVVINATGGGMTLGNPTGGQKGLGTVNAAGLYINGVPVSGGATTTATFTGTLTGYASGPTCSMKYRLTGSFVELYLDTGTTCTGTSNAVTLTMTGLPAAIQPTRSLYAHGLGIDNGILSSAVGFIDSATPGTLRLDRSSVTGTQVAFSPNAWTITGTKGLNAGWVISYDLGN